MRTSRLSLSFALLAPLAVVAHMAAQPQTDPKIDEVLKAARAAMGGEAALAKVQSATVTGSARRVMGEREMTSDVTLDLLLPDKYKRTEDMGFPGGPSFTRVSAVNGADTWDDATNRGGGAMRFGGPGGPGGPAPDKVRARAGRGRGSSPKKTGSASATCRPSACTASWPATRSSGS